LLKQPQYKPLPVEHQVAIVFAGVNGFLDKIPVNRVGEYERAFIPHLVSNHKDLLEEIRKSGDLSTESFAQLKDVTTEFTKNF
ncbi:Alpha subunit of the F1 sector of mitochondrial F1F0 ATP synthase, partial [Linnemannia gamsii]